MCRARVREEHVIERRRPHLDRLASGPRTRSSSGRLAEAFATVIVARPSPCWTRRTKGSARSGRLVESRGRGPREVAAGRCLSASRRTLLDDATLVDDGDAVAHPLGLFHVVRGQDDGRALAARPSPRCTPDDLAALRIEPERRLVEEQHPGLVQQAAHQLEAPLHPARVRPHERVGARGEVDQLEQLVDAPLALRARHAVELRAQLEVLAAGEDGVEGRLLEDDADRSGAPCRARRVTEWPSTSAVPDVGLTMVVSMPTVVVLPAPFGPSRPKISPCSTVRSRPSTAVVAPKTLVSRAVRMTAAMP